MSKKLYGSLSNRLEEGHNYTGRELQVGDDITMYLWSDCNCYYITEVIDQKHIKVKRYYVCADHDKAGGMGHQDWMYFKTLKEESEYLRKYFPDNYKDCEEIVEPEAETWVFRNNKWKEAVEYTPEQVLASPFFFTEAQIKKAQQGKTVTEYRNLSGKVSFGVRRYYYDWSF